MFGIPGPLGLAMMGDGRPDNSADDMSALTKAYAAARAAKQNPALVRPSVAPMPPGGMYPNERVAQGHNMFAPTPMQTTVATPAPLPAPQGAAAPGALSSLGSAVQGAKAMMAPGPAAGPTSVGGAPLSGTDAQWATVGGNPNGTPVGPTSVGGAPLGQLGPTQASGPDVINKLLSFFHSKDNPNS